MANLYPERGFMVVPLNGGPVKFMTYDEYMISSEWRTRVTAYKQVAGWCCIDCGTSENLTGHHRHYLNLGNELPEDIEVLCWPCHKGRHE
jgi:5-methylcytosine-specific restriction endonuclease McrA